MSGQDNVSQSETLDDRTEIISKRIQVARQQFFYSR
jgi:hypothetical protein